MVKTKIMSALIALIIFIPLVILGGIYFKIAVCVISVLGMREFLNLAHKNKRPIYIDVIAYTLVILLTMVDRSRKIYYFLSLLIPFLAVIYCNDNKKYNSNDAFILSSMIIFLGSVFHELINIRIDSIYIFIYLFSITILTDTFAQLGGSLIGKHKLASIISPNKTWEGSIVGGIMGTLCACVFYYIFVSSDVSLLGLFVVTAFLSCLGQFGDLFFSAIKRNSDIKDFSNIMPGHGGVLDRLDSIIFVIIGYVLLSGII